MDNQLITLIGKVFEKKFSDKQLMQREPATVVSVAEGYKRATVKFTNGTQKELLNKSGEKLYMGDSVWVEYRTAVSSGYIAMRNGEADPLSEGGEVSAYVVSSYEYYALSDEDKENKNNLYVVTDYGDGGDICSKVMLGSVLVWEYIADEDKDMLYIPPTDNLWNLFAVYPDYCSLEFEDGYIHIETKGGYKGTHFAYAETIEKVDLRNIKTIHAKVISPTNNSSQYTRLGINSTSNKESPTAYFNDATMVIGEVGETEISLDVSGFAGEYYIHFLCDYGSILEIYWVKLEQK
jgi:hypothetical protein